VWKGKDREKKGGKGGEREEGRGEGGRGGKVSRFVAIDQKYICILQRRHKQDSL